ncbi:hypothetical protein Sjap_026071 [Stephania japonica]|uniref:Uncharacterized protein n=1 Tax=Stephania japonica TaxID=461633 RepID=A0AAP0E2T6_9MAGN
MASTSEMVLCVFVDGVVAALLCGNGGAEKAKNSSNSSDGGAELHVEELEELINGGKVKLVDPNVVSNPNEYQNLAKSMAEHNEVISTYREFKDYLSKESGSDEDMA